MDCNFLQHDLRGDLRDAYLTEQNRTEQNFYLQLNSGHTQVAYEIKQYICQK